MMLISLEQVQQAIQEVSGACPYTDNGESAQWNPGLLKRMAWDEALDELAQVLEVKGP